MNQSKLSKRQLIVLILISLVEVGIGLLVPLMTMKLINQLSDSGFTFGSLIPVIAILILQAVFSAIVFI